MRIPTWTSLSLAIFLVAGLAARAESPSKANVREVIVTHHRNFMIPFATFAAARDQVGEIALFVSTDEGKTWEVASKVSPERGSFRFSAPKDGVYWFAVSPARQGEGAETKLSPSIKVKVETGDQTEEELKAAALETSKKLSRARRRLAEIEGRTEQSTNSDDPLPGSRSTLAEQHARLSLLELEFDVDKALLREAMMKLGKVQLERTSSPVKGDGAEAAAKELHLLQEYVEEKKAALVKRGIELNVKKQQLAETEERLKAAN